MALFYLAGSVAPTVVATVPVRMSSSALELPTYYFDEANQGILDSLGVKKYNEYLAELSQTRDLPEVVVAVLDSGINRQHPVFDGRVLADLGRNYYLNNRGQVVYDDTWDVDQSGHGSHVAGIIADSTLANVKILPVKIFQGGDDETITGDVIKEAIDYVVGLKSQQNLNIVAMNMSLGTAIMKTDSTYYWNLLNYQRYVDTLRGAGILPVVAAGNEGKTQLKHYQANPEEEWYSLPSACSGTMAVSAYNPYDRNRLADFSNFGAHIRLSAPGVRITSAWNSDYGTKTNTVSGTSMATPFVTLCYALLMSDLGKTTAATLGVEWSSADQKYPYYYLNVQHKALLLHATDMGAQGLDTLYGYGGVNVTDFARDPATVPSKGSYSADEVLNPTVAALTGSSTSRQPTNIFDNVQNVFWTLAGVIVVILIINVVRYRFANKYLPKEYQDE